jgi:hypothetical protein
MRPYYNKKPIATVTSLCAALRISEAALRHTAVNLKKHYTPYEIPKRSGKPRTVLIPSLHLKTIQKRINREIFSHVVYPNYLYGGVKNKDYVRNASAHAGAHVLIAVDVKDFYPSIVLKHVVEIYQYLFKFPNDVAQLLAELTTYEGTVPQGACTSSHVANLVLHDVEYHVAQHFYNCKYTYTRLLDDICISSTKPLSEQKISGVMEKIKGMLRNKGLRLKAQKTRISSKSNPEKLMEVTGLWLNRSVPRVNPSQRRSIRSEVFRCEKEAVLDRSSKEYHVHHSSASGKVTMLKYIGHTDADRFRTKLRSILPVYDQNEVTKTVKIVNMLLRTSFADRGKYAYALTYHKARYRINVLARTEAPRARLLLDKLNRCRPTKPSSATLYDDPI